MLSDLAPFSRPNELELRYNELPAQEEMQSEGWVKYRLKVKHKLRVIINTD